MELQSSLLGAASKRRRRAGALTAHPTHTPRSKPHTQGSGSPLDGFPWIGSSAMWGKSCQRGNKVVASLFVCGFAVDVPQASLC